MGGEREAKGGRKKKRGRGLPKCQSASISIEEEPKSDRASKMSD